MVTKTIFKTIERLETSAFMVLAIAGGIIILAIILLAGYLDAMAITVDDGGGADYTKIQDAINNSNNGDTILVYNGTYYEDVNVNKQLILRGIGNPVVNSINLAADGIVLDGFTIGTGSNYFFAGTVGIRVTSNNNMLISNNASSKQYGIHLDSSGNNTLSGNNAFNNEYGIRLVDSSNNILSGNNALNNKYGIWLVDSSNNNMLSGNNANSNWQGIYLYLSSNNMLTGNDASNNYVEGIGLNSYGISLGFSSNNTLRGNNANSNKIVGIYLLSSSNNILISNNANSNNAGIFLLDSNNNTLGNNSANSNIRIGIELASSSSNTLSGNNISSNDGGIRVGPGPFSDSMPSGSNTIYNNYFNNTNNFYLIDTTSNTWNTTTTSGTNIINDPYLGGNFWAYPNGTGFSQTCSDNDNDRICDSPYSLDSNNTDYLPLK